MRATREQDARREIDWLCMEEVYVVLRGSAERELGVVRHGPAPPAA